ncbi:MAG: DUF4298 domain-containing protein [Oscillospiraceae bacterium]|nr:DUF4298 domain-containing protein [Oscillospiraceae bacterium]
MTQLERIERYERILERAEYAVRQMEEAQLAYKGIRKDLAELEQYYTSPEWKMDYEADEAGLLPPDMKRGVLSQDGIDLLLERAKEIELALHLPRYEQKDS